MIRYRQLIIETPEQTVDRVLSWGSYSAQCSKCPVEACSDDPEELYKTLPSIGWKFGKTPEDTICPQH